MGEVSNCIQSAAGIQKTATLRNESVEVSRHKFCYRDFPFSSVTQNGSRSGQLLLNLLHRMPGLESHEEIQQDAEQNDGDDEPPANMITQSERYAAGNKKYEDKGIGEGS